jgi:hypothetical protein
MIRAVIRVDLTSRSGVLFGKQTLDRGSKFRLRVGLRPGGCYVGTKAIWKFRNLPPYCRPLGEGSPRCD